MGKLNYWKAKQGKNRAVRLCSYCHRSQSPDEEFFIIHALDPRIYELFGQERVLGKASTRSFSLCPQCFEKLKDTLEEIESEGWETLDPESEEFKDIDEEIEKYPENGLGT
jgi:hypothetical protein